MTKRLKHNLFAFALYTVIVYIVLLPLKLWIVGISISLLVGFLFGLLNDVITQLRKLNGETFDIDKKTEINEVGEERIFTNGYEVSKELDELLLKFKSTMVCNVLVATKIQESLYYKNEKGNLSSMDDKTNQYEIGTYNNNIVIVDPHMVWDDLRIYNKNKEELIDLSKLGFSTKNLI
jgi:hypothetical protein